MKTKQVQYSYATSPNAIRFKFKTGCYTVALVEQEPGRKPPVAIAAFATHAEAKAFADTLSEPWDRYTMPPAVTLQTA